VIGNVSFDRVILYGTACHVLRSAQGNVLNATAIVHRHCHTKIQARMLHTAGSRSRKTNAHLMRPDLCCEIGFAPQINEHRRLTTDMPRLEQFKIKAIKKKSEKNKHS